LVNTGKKTKKENGGKFTEKEVISHIADFSRQILLWGSDALIKAFSEWRMDAVCRGVGDQETDESININSMVLFEKILLEMRKDVGHSSRNLKTGTILSLILNEPELIKNLQNK